MGKKECLDFVGKIIDLSLEVTHLFKTEIS